MQGYSFPNRPRPKPSIRDGITFAHIINGLGTLIALVLSIIAVVTILGHVNATPVTISDTPSIERLSLYDDTVQTLLSGNSWTPVKFHRQSHMAPGTWRHIVGSGDIVCLKTGSYIVRYMVHSNLPSNPNASFQCKPCQAWLETRCTLQSLSSPNSVTFVSPASGFHSLSNEFMIDANIGDILQIQFNSHCPLIVLSNVTQKRLPQFNTPIASASLLIH